MASDINRPRAPWGRSAQMVGRNVCGKKPHRPGGRCMGGTGTLLFFAVLGCMERRWGHPMWLDNKGQQHVTAHLCSPRCWASVHCHWGDAAGKSCLVLILLCVHWWIQGVG